MIAGRRNEHNVVSKSRRRATTLGLLSLSIFALTACAGQEETGGEETQATDVSQFAIVAPENESDYGWNQAGLEGAERASEETGVELDRLADAGWDNDETVFAQLASAGNDFIIAHASGFSEAAQTASEQEGVPVLVVDHGETVEDRVAVQSAAGEEGGYLAGVAAAHSTETNTIGIVTSADDINWFSMTGGFAEGVYSVDPDIEVIYSQLGPNEYADSAGGRSTTDQLISAGADVIFGMGDGATVGYLQAIETSDSDVKYIGTVGDVTEVVDDPSMLLTSVQWNFESAYVSAIEDIQDGNYGHSEEGYELNLENGGISLQDGLPTEIQEEVDTVRDDIISGNIDVTRANTAEEATTIIDGGNGAD